MCWVILALMEAWHPRMAEFDSAGGITNYQDILTQRGWSVGMAVVRKADKQEGEILDIQNQKVTVLHPDGNAFEYSCSSFVEGQWKQAPKKKDPELVEWANFPVIETAEMCSHRMKGRIADAMVEQWSDKMTLHGAIEVQCNPKDVKVNKDVASGKLVLSCAMSRILFEKPQGEPSGIVIGMYDSHRVVIANSTAFPKLKEDGSGEMTRGSFNPFWIVKVTDEPEKANMKLTGVQSTQNLKLDPSVNINLPLMRNSKKLESGDSLVLYATEMPKKRAVDAETPVPVPKRPRA